MTNAAIEQTPHPPDNFAQANADEPLPKRQTLPRGTVFANRYEIVRPLGEGVSSIAYLAIDRARGQVVTLKVLRDQFVGNGSAAQAILKERAALIGFRHPRLPQLVEGGHFGYTWFLVIAHAYGHDLRSLIDNEGGTGPLSIRESADILLGLISALIEVQALGLVHHDLKPENIVVRRGNPFFPPLVTVVDFGQASAEGALLPNVAGSLAYLSPQHALNGTSSWRCDQYAVGIIAHELFGKRRPRGIKPLFGFEPQPYLQDLVAGNVGVSPECFPPGDAYATLPKVVARAIRFDPEDRYPSWIDFAEALMPFASAAGRRQFEQENAQAYASWQAPTEAYLERKAVERRDRFLWQLARLALLAAVSAAFTFWWIAYHRQGAL